MGGYGEGGGDYNSGYGKGGDDYNSGYGKGGDDYGISQPQCKRSQTTKCYDTPRTVSVPRCSQKIRQGLRIYAHEGPHSQREAALPQRGQEGLRARGAHPAEAGEEVRLHE